MNPVDRQVQAQEDLERIARALYDAYCAATFRAVYAWEDQPEWTRRRWRTIARNLLLSDVIRVGKRPERGEAPMAGQASLDA